MVLLDVEDAGNRGEVVLAAARRARFAILTALTILTVVAVLALATGATSAFAASTPSLGVVAVGQLDVQDGLDDGRVGFRRGFTAFGSGQRQIEGDMRGFHGSLAHRATAA